MNPCISMHGHTCSKVKWTKVLLLMSRFFELCSSCKDKCNRVKLSLIILSLCLFCIVPICSCAPLLLCLHDPVPICPYAWLLLCLFASGRLCAPAAICSSAHLMLCLFAPLPMCLFGPFQSFWNSRNFVSEPLELVAKLLELPKLFSKLWGLLQGRSGAVGNSFQSLWSSWNFVLELSELLEAHFEAFGGVGSWFPSYKWLWCDK